MAPKAVDSAVIAKTFTDADVRAFADVVGNHNPVHFSDEFAFSTFFGRRIAHGMLGASLISAVTGNHLPCPGSIYLSQSLQFLAPVYPGDAITTKALVTKLREDTPFATLQSICSNQLASPGDARTFAVFGTVICVAYWFLVDVDDFYCSKVLARKAEAPN